MYIKKKVNRSGSTTVTVVSKSKGKIRYLKNFGTSSDEADINRMTTEAQKFIDGLHPSFDFDGELYRLKEAEITATEDFLSRIDSVLLNAPKVLLNKVLKVIGFDSIEDEIFRSLVVARLTFPSSKRATVDYLKAHFDEDIALHKIYRYLDKLDDSTQDVLQEISVNHTTQIYGGKIGVLFYDVTTLYFETNNTDELLQCGFSKDGKHSNPQIVLGLLVSSDGCPLAYSINEGSKFEGHTMLPVIENFTNKFNLSEFVVVADAGMMNQKNIDDLENKGYKYIVGARIKNMSNEIKQWILSLEKTEAIIESKTIDEKTNRQLLIGYSKKRARLDATNREKGLNKLCERYKSGVITKSNITQRGYNKFLSVEGTTKITVSIDDKKVAEDKKWDGLKGYLTNASLQPEEVVKAYHDLYNVEQSFRISKSKLDIRPMFHFNHKRIKAHISICFVALKVYREFERLLKKNSIALSVDTVLKIAKTIPTIRVKTSDGYICKTLFLTPQQKQIEAIFDDQFWGSQILIDNQ